MFCSQISLGHIHLRDLLAQNATTYLYVCTSDILELYAKFLCRPVELPPPSTCFSSQRTEKDSAARTRTVSALAVDVSCLWRWRCSLVIRYVHRIVNIRKLCLCYASHWHLAEGAGEEREVLINLKLDSDHLLSMPRLAGLLVMICKICRMTEMEYLPYHLVDTDMVYAQTAC